MSPGPGPHVDRELVDDAIDHAAEERLAVAVEKLNDEVSKGGNGKPTTPPNPTATPDDGGALRAVQAMQAAKASHEADGGTVVPLGDQSEALFGEDGQRKPLEEIAAAAKLKSAQPGTPSREEIAALQQKEMSERGTVCEREVVDVLIKHNCQLDAVVSLAQNADGSYVIVAQAGIRAL